MARPSIKSPWIRAGAVLSLAALPFASNALAQDGKMLAKVTPASHTPPQSEITIPATEKEAWEQAGEFAKANPAVGIAVYGRPEDGTSQQVAEMIQGFFARNEIKSQYFLADKDRVGVSIGLYLADQQFGPADLPHTVQNANTIVQNFPFAWPKQSASSIAGPLTADRN